MSKLERVTVFVLFLLATGAGQAFFANPALTDDRGQPLTQAAFGLIYIALVLSLVRYRSAVVSLLKKEKWTALLCLWCLASVAWSVDPAESLRHLLALIGTSIAALFLALHYEPKEQLRLAALALGFGAIASLAVALVLPSVGFTSDGSMQGIYYLKNSLGRMMSLGAFCFALQVFTERRNRVLRTAMFLVCCVLLVLSRSATAIVVTALMLMFLPLCKVLCLSTRKLIAATAVLLPFTAAAVLCAVESSDQILQALGRDASLTGRIPLWHLVMKEIAERPILGFGFSAFWHSWEGQRLSDTVAWDVAVPHAHNGFLEIWLGLGIVGLAMVLISIGRNLIQALRTVRSQRDMEHAWPLLLIVFTILYNLTENSLLSANSAPWIAYGAATFWLVRAEQEVSFDLEPEAENEPVYSS